MLRYERRWHDAANGPLLGEARLLWLRRVSNPLPAPLNPEEPGISPAEKEARVQVLAEREYIRRQAMEILAGDHNIEQVKAGDILAESRKVEQSLDALDAMARKIETGVANNDSLKAEMDANRAMLDTLRRRAHDHAFTLNELGVEQWEDGTMPPNEFLRRFEAHIRHLDTIDDADTTLNAEDRLARAEHRVSVVNDVREAVRRANAAQPASLPMERALRADPDATEETVWATYSLEEKKPIITAVSNAALLNGVKSRLKHEIDDTKATLEEEAIEKKLGELGKKMAESVTNERLKEVQKNASEGKGADGGDGGGIPNPFTALNAGWTKLNEAAGIEWLTAYEWYDAFKEVFESIAELRKQKSRLRVSKAASTIGRVASLIPGTGGKALTALLDQQQEQKNAEIKDGFVKELKNNRIDFGFTDLFGGNGKAGELSYYAALGDTNRTQAILEFAAGKAMLYKIKGAKWQEYMLPGGIPFRKLVPAEWTDDQVGSYFSNLGFMNKQGQDGQIKAGEELVSGGAKFEDYTEPFEGAVSGLSLWFAKGIANKAMTKVKEGEMSATLTLIVLNEWANNPVFRENMDWDWWDRLAGDSKQMTIGMIKYDKGHFFKGRDKGETSIARANDGKTKPRIGPLIAGVEQYLQDKDPTLKNDDPKTKARLRSLTAKLIACKTLKGGVNEKDLPNGVNASLFADELRPLHIQYDPNEIRDAAVDKLGDDNFIERSEIINTSAEVMKYVGTLRENGFAEPTKARYFFSHIIDAYDELAELAAAGGADQAEFRGALRNFYLKENPNLDEWIERALQQSGASALLTEMHADQGKKGKGQRKIVLTLMQKGLVSESVVRKLSEPPYNSQAARQLLKEFRDAGGQDATSYEHIMGRP